MRHGGAFYRLWGGSEDEHQEHHAAAKRWGKLPLYTGKHFMLRKRDCCLGMEYATSIGGGL